MTLTAQCLGTMKTLIVIPSRHGSTRFPGKPLHKIAGKTLLQRVVGIAVTACEQSDNVEFVVATDHQAIADHAAEIGAPSVMTDPDLPSGSDRALAAMQLAAPDADFIINLQGDAPFTPPGYIAALIEAAAQSNADVVTPVVQLSWDDLDIVREQKKTSPFSGTSCVFDQAGDAKWFSKMVLPAIRKESDLRKQNELSPVWRHIGLYGYRRAALERFVSLPEGYYEKLEGLEQLRFLENSMRIQVVKVAASAHSMWGVDTPEDAAYAERLLTEA